MSLDIVDRNGRFAQALVIAQLTLALGAMLIFIFAPRPNEPVTLYPLNDSAARALPATISEPGSLLVGRGLLDRSYVITGERPGFLEGIFEDGVLILNASVPGCGVAPNRAQMSVAS